MEDTATTTVEEGTEAATAAPVEKAPPVGGAYKGELPAGVDDSQVVKPVALANELKIKPQIVYGWIRTGNLPFYTKGGDGRYLLRDEVAAWQAAREARKTERAQKAAAAAEEAKAKAEKGETAPAAEAAAEEATPDEEF